MAPIQRRRFFDTSDSEITSGNELTGELEINSEELSTTEENREKQDEPQVQEEQVVKEKVVVSVKDLVEKLGATCEEPDRWGMRKYAYPINYKNEGFYCLMNFKAEDEVPAQITSKLNINKNINW